MLRTTPSSLCSAPPHPPSGYRRRIPSGYRRELRATALIDHPAPRRTGISEQTASGNEHVVLARMTASSSDSRRPWRGETANTVDLACGRGRQAGSASSSRERAVELRWNG